MRGANSETAAIRAAVYVDFDNIYKSLKEVSERAASLFATQPDRWLSWFKSGYHVDPGTFSPRSILIRNCYLNPVLYGKFRTDFVRAGFSVIDCPPLTSKNKNSADIYMVLSVVDMLAHPTHIDEFIILSADADFTPVVHRLRAHDRRTTILANEVVASAYKAACDFVVEQNTFIEDAIGITSEEDEVKVEDVALADIDYKDVVTQVAYDVRTQLCNQGGELHPEHIPDICKKYPIFDNSNWFGYFSLKRLAQEIVQLQPEIGIVIDDLGDDWKLVYVGTPLTTLPAQTTSDSTADDVCKFVADMVNKSAAPTLLSYVGMQIIKRFGNGVRDTDWFGKGSLSDLIEQDPSGKLKLHHQGEGQDYVYNFEIHDVSDVYTKGLSGTSFASKWVAVSQPLRSLVERVSRVTGVPALPPDVYASLFEKIAEAVNDGHQNSTALSKAVRDRMAEGGDRVSRNQINYVLTGLRHADVNVVASADLGASMLSDEWLKHVIDMCDVRGLQLAAEDESLMRAWLCSARPSERRATG